MSLIIDITADQPPLPRQLVMQDFTSEEVAALAEELLAYHQHFAPLLYRREQREWVEIYVRGLLTAKDMVTLLLFCSGWSQRDYGIWLRFHAIRRSGRSWKWTGKHSERVRVVGSGLRLPPAKGLLPAESACILTPQPKWKCKSWRNNGPPRLGAAFACWRDTKVRWSPIFSCCVPFSRLIACQVRRSGS